MFGPPWTLRPSSPSGSMSHSPSRTTANAPIQVSAGDSGEGVLVTRSSSQTGIPGTVTPWFGLASRTTCTRPSDFEARLKDSSGTLRIGRGFSTTTSIRRRHSLHHSWTSSNYSCTGTPLGGDTDEVLSGHHPNNTIKFISQHRKKL